MGREKIREEAKDLPGPSWVASQNKRAGGTTSGSSHSNVSGGMKAFVSERSERELQ